MEDPLMSNSNTDFDFEIMNGVLTFSDDYTIILEKQFKGNTTIRKIIIGKNIKSIGAEAFSCCPNVSEIEVLDNNKYYCPFNSNTIIERDTGLLVFGCYKSIIGKEVKAIGSFAFCGQTKLTDISIPGNCKIIGAYAFDGCENLISISMADGVSEIHEFAFKKCDRLESVSFPNTLTSVADSAFGKTICLDEDCYGMLLDEGCVKVNHITFSGEKKDFYRVTNFQKIFVLDSNLSYSDMIIKRTDGEIVFSNKTIDW